MPRNPPPTDAPKGTVWIGGDVECLEVCLRVLGDELDPQEITAILGLEPTRGGRKGEPIVRPNGEISRHRRIGAWLLDLHPTTETTVDEALTALIGQLPPDPEVWQSLAQRFEIDLICDIKVRGVNQGFVFPSHLLKTVAEMGIPLGVDIFCETDDVQSSAITARLGGTD